MDPVATYLAASAGCDIDALLETLSPDARVYSPISGRMVFAGRDDLRVLLDAVYRTTSDLRWEQPIGDGPTRAVVGTCRIAGLLLTDAMVLRVADDGTIDEVRPHLRPWLSLTTFALLLGPKVARHPGMVARALRLGAR